MPKETRFRKFEKLEKFALRDARLSFTIICYLMAIVVAINVTFVNSVLIGIPATTIYFMINGIFLGNALFEKEDPFLRFMLSTLLLIVFLGLISWVVMMIYNLDAMRSAIVLCTVTTLSSFMSKMAKYSISIEFSRNKSNA